MTKRKGDALNLLCEEFSNDQDLKVPKYEPVEPVELNNALYFTKVVGHPRRFSRNALSLSELLKLIDPKASIHFNFMIDLPWLFAQYPSQSARNPLTLIIGEDGNERKLLRQQAVEIKAENIKIGCARLPIPFGTHHTKLSIFESNNEKIHLIISTANLLSNDWEDKTQAFYHCSGEIMTDNEEGKNDDAFRNELLEYLYFYNNSRDSKLIEPWRDLIKKADFSAIKARIIFSVPGSHKGSNKEKYGHLRLRNELRNLNLVNPTFHAQFSSIGSLGPKPESWLCGQFLTSLSGGKSCASSKLKLIYPCVEDVRCSIEGYLAGGSLPYRAVTATKQEYLINFMYKWRSEKFGRTHVMPHIKSYSAFNEDSSIPSWMLITSANLSKAAWGELQKNETQLTIRSYELGILLIDDASMALLPYDIPLTKYETDDKPWVYDLAYQKKDRNGISWPVVEPSTV